MGCVAPREKNVDKVTYKSQTVQLNNRLLLGLFVSCLRHVFGSERLDPHRIYVRTNVVVKVSGRRCPLAQALHCGHMLWAHKIPLNTVQNVHHIQ